MLSHSLNWNPSVDPPVSVAGFGTDNLAILVQMQSPNYINRQLIALEHLRLRVHIVQVNRAIGHFCQRESLGARRIDLYTNVRLVTWKSLIGDDRGRNHGAQNESAAQRRTAPVVVENPQDFSNVEVRLEPLLLGKPGRIPQRGDQVGRFKRYDPIIVLADDLFGRILSSRIGG